MDILVIALKVVSNCVIDVVDIVESLYRQTWIYNNIMLRTGFRVAFQESAIRRCWISRYRRSSLMMMMLLVVCMFF